MSRRIRRRWGKAWTIDRDLLISVVRAAVSYADVARRLGFSRSGSQYQSLRWRIREEKFDCSHFDAFYGRRINPENILKNTGKRSTGFTLKKALLKAGRPYICADCKTGPEWNGKLLVLQVDHVDGNNVDHRPENLEFRCPNCHSQTPTWGFKSRCQVVQK